MRLVNMHKARVGNGKAEKEYALVPHGATADFNAENPTIAILLKAGLLVPEGTVLASKALALTDAPSMTELVQLRADLAQARAALAEGERLALAHAEERKRIESAFSDLVAENEGLKAKCAELTSALDSLTKPAAPPPASPLPKAGPGRQQREG